MQNHLGTNTDLAGEFTCSFILQKGISFRQVQETNKEKKNRLVIYSFISLITTAAIFNQSKLNSIKSRFSQFLKQ